MRKWDKEGSKTQDLWLSQFALIVALRAGRASRQRTGAALPLVVDGPSFGITIVSDMSVR